MVDVTFPFIILFGGPLAAWMVALVRGHRGGRKALDILAAAICGPLATTLWMSLAGRLFARGPNDPYMSREWASFLADLLWFSPVIGGFFGVAAVAIAYRIAGHGPVRPQELGREARRRDRHHRLGLCGDRVDANRRPRDSSTDFLALPLLYELLVGPFIVLVGWVLARIFRTPEAKPAPPSPS